MISFRRFDRQVFDRNWDALCFYHPRAAESIRQALALTGDDACPDLRAIPQLEGIRDILVDSEHGLIAVRSDGTQVEIAGLEWDSSDRVELRRVLTEAKPRVLFLYSSGDFSCLDDCHALAGFDQKVVLVLEYRTAVFLAALATRDRTGLLSHPNLFFCVGPRFRSEALCVADEQALFLVPPASVVGTAGAGFILTGDRDEYLSSLRELLLDLAETRRDFAPRYDQFMADLGRSQSCETPCQPRIWGYAVAPEKMLYSIHLEMLQVLFAGFLSAGCDARLFIEPRERWTTRLRMLRDIVSFGPDIYFFLNTLSNRFFQVLFGPSWGDDKVRRPRFVWLLDEFAFSPIGSAEGLGTLDHVFAMDPEYVERLSGRGLGSLHYLPVVASIRNRGTVRECYQHPVSFVGSVVDLSSLFNLLDRGDRDWFEDRVDRVRKGETIFAVLPDDLPELRSGLLEVAQEYAGKVRKPFLRGPRAVRYLLSVEANTRKRVEAVRALLPHGIAVYGPPDWVNLLPEEAQENYHAPLPFDQLPDLFASSLINLNLHSLQCPTSLNPRDFDILAGGGFLLSDHVPEAERGLLVDGRDAVFFRDLAHLSEKVGYYLENEDRRLQIAHQGCKTVREKHMLLHRAADMLTLFSRAL